jgi:hypothetical protein
MFRLSLAAALAVLLLVPGAGAVRADGAPLVDFQRAFAIAQAQVPKGLLVVARVEDKGQFGGKVFGFYFLLGGSLIEIEINGNGDVVKKTDPSDPKKVVSPDVVALLGKKGGRAKLPPGRLMEIAAASLKNTPLSGMKYLVMGGKLVIQIGSLLIDAETGQILQK